MRARRRSLGETAALGGRADGGATDQDLRDGLRAAWVEVAGDDPGVQLGYYELTALALRNPSMRELARHQCRSYRDLAARALAPVPKDAEPRRAAALAQFFAVTFDGLASTWPADPEGTDPEQVLDLLADSVSGRRATAATPARTHRTPRPDTRSGC